ncbi:MAG: prepilin-type N-terminal cleavage/methylation domain-containing protein [Terriglobales bacterium]
MSNRLKKRESGFSLVEMMASVALGAIVLSAAVQMYTKGLSATWMVTQRAEMQEDFRAASNMLTKDLSLAGAGLGTGAAIALPSGTTPQYGCDQSKTCYINGVAGLYPVNGGVPYMYGLIPGYNKGPILNVSQGATDVVTTIYTDSSFYLNCFTPQVTSKGVVTFSQPVSPNTWGTEGCLPYPVTVPQAPNDAAAGLVAGDVVMMTLNGSTIVAEVTGAVSTTGSGATETFSVPFADNDALKLNQTGSGTGLNSVPLNALGASSAAPCGAQGPCRIMIVTYYIDSTVAPPRLMRQVSGHSPMPVVENVAWMKFSFDMFNDSTDSPATSCANPGSATPACSSGSSVGLLPNQISKINILNMAINSTQMGSQFGLNNGYQRMDLQTSVCARNLTYNNDYPN